MSKKSKRYSYKTGGIIMFVFIIYTVAVKLIDVKPIGPEKSKVGFAAINVYFRDRIEFNNFWYKTSEIFGILVILTACLFAVMALIQLIRRKNIWRIDKNIISLGVFYVAVIFIYIFFEKIIINYRPVILDEGLEASYPSSHTVLAICIMGSAVIQFRKYFKTAEHRRCADIIAAFICAITILGRVLSGVHWFSDIIGGLILSMAMLRLYNSAFNRIERNQRRLKMQKKQK